MSESFDWKCPTCGRSEFEILMARKHLYSMEPRCACGFTGEDLHFIGQEAREREQLEKEKAA